MSAARLYREDLRFSGINSEEAFQADFVGPESRSSLKSRSSLRQRNLLFPGINSDWSFGSHFVGPERPSSLKMVEAARIKPACCRLQGVCFLRNTPVFGSGRRIRTCIVPLNRR
jgi:hypothetical protein